MKTTLTTEKNRHPACVLRRGKLVAVQPLNSKRGGWSGGPIQPVNGTWFLVLACAVSVSAVAIYVAFAFMR